MFIPQSREQPKYSPLFYSVLGIISWIGISAWMLTVGFAWFVYLITGIIMLTVAHGWGIILRHERISSKVLIAWGVSAGIVLLTSAVVFMLT